MGTFLQIPRFPIPISSSNLGGERVRKRTYFLRLPLTSQVVAKHSCQHGATEQSSSELRVNRTNVYLVDSYILHLTMLTLPNPPM